MVPFVLGPSWPSFDAQAGGLLADGHPIIKDVPYLVLLAPVGFPCHPCWVPAVLDGSEADWQAFDHWVHLCLPPGPTVAAQEYLESLLEKGVHSLDGPFSDLIVYLHDIIPVYSYPGPWALLQHPRPSPLNFRGFWHWFPFSKGFLCPFVKGSGFGAGGVGGFGLLPFTTWTQVDKFFFHMPFVIAILFAGPFVKGFSWLTLIPFGKGSETPAQQMSFCQGLKS